MPKTIGYYQVALNKNIVRNLILKKQSKIDILRSLYFIAFF